MAGSSSIEFIRKSLVKAVEPLLSRQQEDGKFKQENAEASTAYDMQAIYPFSYLYQTKFTGNRYYQDKKLLESIIKIGDTCATNTNENGLMYYYSFGNSGYSLDQRFLIFWLDAYVLIEKELEQKTKKKWVSAMKRSLLYLEKKVSSFNSQEVFNSYSFGTSPNHASLYACALFLGGVVFKKNRWQSISRKFMDTFVAFQTEEGFWPEGHGPVGVYCSVSLAGVSRMNKELKGCYNDSLAKALEYFKKISYQDFSFVELTDKRNQYHKDGMTWGFYGFSETDEGRSFAVKSIEANVNHAHQFGGEFCARLLENFVHMKKGPVHAYKHWSGTQFLGNHSAFIRKNLWQINYSVNPVVVHPKSSFRLDYGRVFSVWHQSTGLLIDGSQGKNNDHHNTFYNKNGFSLGQLYGGRIHTNVKDPCIEVLYSECGNLTVKTSFVSAKELILSGQIEKKDKYKNEMRFNVPLFLHIKDIVLVGNKKVFLSTKKMAMKLKKGTKIKLHGNKVLFTLHCDGVLHFPEFPFNPYSKDNSSSIEAAFLRLELIPDPQSLAADLSILIK